VTGRDRTSGRKPDAAGLDLHCGRHAWIKLASG